MKINTVYRKIDELVNTIICGNKTSLTEEAYENMLKSLRSKDFLRYTNDLYPDFRIINFIYRKVDKVKALAEMIQGVTEEEIKEKYDIRV
jgi:hypothetical protein